MPTQKWIDNIMVIEMLRARLIVAGVAYRMLLGSLRRRWTRGRDDIIANRAARLLSLAEVE